jgi:hypothetical protein
VGLCALLLASLAAADTTFTFDSEGPGDFVGKGESGVVTDADGEWIPSNQLTTFRDMRLRFEETADPSNYWDLHFGAADGAELVPGDYPSATGSYSQTPPFIDVAHDGRGCGSQASGNFNVSAIQHDVYGNPVRFVAEFLQRCQADDPALTGMIDHTFEGTLGPATFTPGNFLLMYKNKYVFGAGNLFEFTPAGTQVQVMPLARPAGGPPAPNRLSRFDDRVKDVIMDASGRIHVFLGDADPWLGSFDPATGDWQYQQFPEWSVSSSSDRSGALAAFGNLIYATDDAFSFDATGIIRFDADGVLPTQRFADTEQYVDVAAGFDGKLYALRRNDTDSVDVFDPDSMNLLRTIALATGVSGIAVNAAGEIFATTYGSEFQGTLGRIYHFDQDGATLNSLTTNVEGTFDIDLTRSGDIVIGRSSPFADPAGPRVVVTDTSLASWTEFSPEPASTNYPHTFVAWVQPPPSPVFSAGGFESGDTSAWSTAVGAAAGLLDVTTAAAFGGGFGLEVTVGGMCTAESDPVITSPSVIEGTFVGCTSLTASGVQVGGGGATFAAGQRIVLGEGFSVATGAPFEATLDTGLLSGLAYLEDDSPAAATSYNASFELRLDDLAIGVDGGVSDTVEIFSGFSGAGTAQFRAIVKRDAADTEYRLVLEARRDDGTFVATQPADEITLATGWHTLRFGWQAGEGDGFFFVTVDGGLPAGGLGSFDNGEQVLDAVRLGYIGGSAASTTGTFDVDDFSSWM